MAQSISRRWAFLGLLRLIAGAFSERLRPLTGYRNMSSQPSPTSARQIIWPSVVTVISAAILFGPDDTGAHILQAVLFAIGVFIMVTFIRAAQRVEPFTRRA